MFPRNYEEELHTIDELIADEVMEGGSSHILANLQNQRKDILEAWQQSIGL